MSRTIDERVVKMEFDNQRFESNVKESLSTIDKLKKSMDFDSAKAFGNIDKAASKVSFSGLLSGIETVRSKFSLLDVASYTVMSRITNSLIDFGKKIVTAIPSQIKEGGISRALNIEQAKFQLEGLGIAWDKIKDNINDGVEDTAYGLDAAAKAAAQLVASGVQVGDEMSGILKGISGVAAMTNSSYEEISHIFTTAAGQGKVMTQQLRELEHRGLNAAATLAKSMGTSEAAVREMVTKGQIDFKTFSNAMTVAFADHAKDANKTFTGALANMKAALSRIGASFTTPAMNNLMHIFNELRNTFNNIHKALGPVITVFERLAVAIKRSVVGSLHKFNDWFENFGGKNKVIEAMNWALGSLLERLIPIKKAFQSVFPKTTADNIDAMADAVINFTKSLRPSEIELQALYYIFQGLFNAIKIIGNVIKTIAKGLAKFGPVLAPLTTLVTLFVIFGATLGKIVPKVVSFINTIRMLLPLLKVLGIVAAGALGVLAGITVVKLIVANFDKIKTGFKTLGITISNWFNDLKSKYPLLQKISDFFAGLGVKLKNVGSAIAQFAKMAYNAFSQNGFIGGFKKLGEQLRATVEGVNRVKRRSVEMADAYNLAAKRTGKAVSVTIGEEETTFQKFAATLLGIGDKIKWFFANIKNILTVDNIKKGFHNLGETMYNTFAKIGDVLERSGVADKLRETGSAIVDFVKNLNYGKIAAIGFATALITLIFRFSSMFKGIGTLTREAGLFLKSLRGGLFNIKLIRPDYTSSLNKLALGLAILAGSLTLLIALYGQHPQELVNIAAILGALGLSLLGFALIAGKLGAFKSFSMTMLSLSAGIGILVASLLILDHVNMDTIFEKVSVLAGIAIALAVAMKIIGKMEKSSVTNIFFAIAFAASVAILIKSLVKAFQELKGYSWQEMIIAAGGIAGVIGMLAVLASNMGKVKNFGSTLGILAFTAFMAVFGKSLATVFDALPPDKLKGYLKAIDAYKEVAIGIGVLAVIMLGVASKAGEGMQKLGTGLLAMAAAIGILAFVVVKMTEWAKTLTEADVGPVLAALGIVAALILLCAGFQRLSTKTVKLGESVKQANMGWTFLAMAAAILAMGKAMEMIADIPQEKYGQALGALATMGAILAGVTALSFLSEKANTRAILAIAVVIGSISLSLMLLSLFAWDDIIPGLVSLSVCMGVFALILWSMNNLKPNKNAVKTLIPIAIMLGVLGAELAVLSNLPWVSVAVAGAAMTAALYSLSKVIKAVSGSSGLGGKTADKKFKNLMAITLMLTAIGVSLVALSYQPWEQIATAGAGMVACMYMLTKVIKAVSDIKTGSCEKKISILREVSIMMAALGASLWIASQNHWSQIAAAGASMTAVMYVLTKIIKVINETKPNEKATKQLAQVAAILIEIAIPIAALSFLDIAGMATAAGLMTGVIIALAVISSKIGNTKVKTSAVKQLAYLAAILYEVAIPIALLSFLDIGGMAVSAGLMAGVMLALVGIAKLIEKAKIKSDDVWNMVEMAAAMLLVAGSMALLGSIISDPASMLAAAGALSIAIGVISLSLGLLTNFTQGMDLAATAGAIAIVAAACVGLAAAVKIVEGVDWSVFQNMGKALGTVVAVLAVFAGIIAVLNFIPVIGQVISGIVIGAMEGLASAFALFSLGVLELGVAMAAAGVGIKIGAEGLEVLLPILQEMVTLPIGDMAKSLLTLSLGLASLGIAGLGMLVGAAGFAAFALAIRAGFIPAMLELARIGNEELVPLAANIRTLVDAFKPMEELSAVLIPVGVAFTLFGAAIALAGIGIYNGAQGLYTLAPALQQLQPLLTEDFINQMIILAGGLIAIGGAGIILGMGSIGLNLGGAGLIVLAQGLAAMNNVAADAGSIGAAMEAVSTGLQKIGQAGMTLAFGAMGLIMGGAGLLVLLPSLIALSSGDINMEMVGQQFEKLAQGSTSFAKAGMLLLVGAPGVLMAAAAIMVLGNALTNFQGKFTTALLTMDKTIQVLSKTTLETAKKNYTAVGVWIPQSIIKGMLSGQTALVKTGAAMAKALEESIRNVLGIHSASEILAAIGEWICKSLGIGIQRSADGTINIMATVTEAIKGKCADAANSIAKSLGIGQIFESRANKGLTTADAINEKFGRAADSGGYLNTMMDDLFGQFKDMVPSVDDLTGSLGDLSGGLGDAAGSAGKAKNSFESLKDTIEQQMDIFSEFNMKTEITGDQMLANMRSQVQGVAQWAANLQMLAARGIDQGLLAKLSELGPQGYEKVAAFVQMTDAQLQEANQLYATSLMLPGSAAAQITGSFAAAGRDATQGFLNGWDTAQLNTAGIDGANQVLTGFTGTMQIGSPSRVMENNGMFAMQGLRNGIFHYMMFPVNMMVTVANKIVSTARNELGGSKFEQIGKQMMEGLKRGIENNSNGVIDKMKSIAQSIIDAAKAALKIESPSKVFYGIGRYIDLGLMRGISENASQPINSIDELTNQLTYKMGSLAATINELLNEDLDAQPTITPVLDLTNLQNGIGVASSLLASRTVRLSATQASIQNGTGSAEIKTNGSGNTVYTFTQNNYSPKALDRSEIYRQTRNQFSQIKQARV